MQPKKFLFANVPADGHFNPLTGLAVQLKELGHDVRWYSQDLYAAKISKLGIRHYPFKKAMQINQFNFEEHFPERNKISNKIKKLNFDMHHVFINRGPEYYEDIKAINNEFCFDMLIADISFTGIPYVKELLQKAVIGISVFPLIESSKDLAPNGLGMTPAKTFLEKQKHALLRYLCDRVLFRSSNKLSRKLLKAHGIDCNESLFNTLIRKSDIVLQSGTPGFEYYRSDMGSNVHFVGPLWPHTSQKNKLYELDERYRNYGTKILVTQGTVEKDPEKLVVPTLEAFKNTDVLVIVTTGGSQTKELKQRYPQVNFIIEDFIPFDAVMPWCDAYVTNGGYGGVLLGIKNKLPMVVAGVHEGKSEICARVGYFELGIDLKTEKPQPLQIRRAVAEVTSNRKYKNNVMKLNDEFSQYRPEKLCLEYIEELLSERMTAVKTISSGSAAFISL